MTIGDIWIVVITGWISNFFLSSLLVDLLCDEMRCSLKTAKIVTTFSMIIPWLVAIIAIFIGVILNLSYLLDWDSKYD